MALLLGVAGPAQAQEPAATAGPLGGLETPVPGLRQADLDGYLPARFACQKLLTLVNAVGGRWDLVRRRIMDRVTFQEDRGRDDLDWDVAWGECSRARRDLEEGLPRQVLDYEVQLAKGLWRALAEVADGYLGSQPVNSVNVHIAAYGDQLAAWIGKLPLHQAFWNGAYLEERPSPSCVRDLEHASQEAALSMWTLAASPTDEGTPDRRADLAATLAGIDSARNDCRAESGEDRIALQLFGDLVVVYRRALKALAENDDDGIRSAMLEEQEWISLLAGCRKQHRKDEPLAPVCAPREPLDSEDEIKEGSDSSRSSGGGR